MEKVVLLGDEAVALGAIHSGLTAAYSYPGTPASEIMEFLIRQSAGGKNFVAKWCVNEKVAMEEALGVSFAGQRAMVSFKHVGLNVAADPLSMLLSPGPTADWLLSQPMILASILLKTNRIIAFMLILPECCVLNQAAIRKPMIKHEKPLTFRKNWACR